MNNSDKYNNQPIILFDGICNLCNGFVQFVIKRDKHQQFLFGSLQSDEAKELLNTYHVKNQYLKTIILIDKNKKVYTQSTAVLRIFKRLDKGWKLMYGFIVIPTFLRDVLYKWIAKNRYKWFGKRDSCMVPTKNLMNRFIDNL